MIITALALLSSPADAKPSVELCRTHALGTIKVTTAACSCLELDENDSLWWRGVQPTLKHSDSASAAGLCFEVSAYPYAEDSKYLFEYATRNVLSRRSNQRDPYAGGWYWLESPPSSTEQIVWTEVDAVDNLPPLIIAIPLPWDPNNWGFHNAETGELLASSVGNGSSVSHATYGDFDNDGLMDMLVTFEDGATWELNGITDPHELYTPPPPPQQQP